MQVGNFSDQFGFPNQLTQQGGGGLNVENRGGLQMPQNAPNQPVQINQPSRIEQGVTFEKPTGNQMPSPDLPSETPAGVSGFVYFFEPTLVNMGVPSGEVGTFLMTNKTLIAKSLAIINFCYYHLYLLITY